MREGWSLLPFSTLENSFREVEHQPKVTQPAGGLSTQILNPSYIIPVGVLHPRIWRDNFIMNSYGRDLSILRFCITNLLQMPRDDCVSTGGMFLRLAFCKLTEIFCKYWIMVYSLLHELINSFKIIYDIVIELINRWTHIQTDNPELSSGEGGVVIGTLSTWHIHPNFPRPTARPVL